MPAPASKPAEEVPEVPLEQQVLALVERLRLGGQEADAKLVKRLQERLEHTQYWYGTRHERLWHWAHEELTPELCHRFFSIVANGTVDGSEPPTYAQQFNMMKHRMEVAERQLAAQQDACRALNKIS